MEIAIRIPPETSTTLHMFVDAIADEVVGKKEENLTMIFTRPQVIPVYYYFLDGTGAYARAVICIIANRDDGEEEIANVDGKVAIVTTWAGSPARARKMGIGIRALLESGVELATLEERYWEELGILIENRAFRAGNAVYLARRYATKKTAGQSRGGWGATHGARAGQPELPG